MGRSAFSGKVKDSWVWRRQAGVLFLKILVVVFIAELLNNVALAVIFQLRPDYTTYLLHAFTLIFFLTVPIFLLAVKPLLQHMDMKRAVLNRTLIKLDERSQFAATILSSIQSGIIVTDPDLRITLANRYAGEFFGRSEAELQGMPLSEVCPGIAAELAASRDAGELLLDETNPDLALGFKRFDLNGSNNLPAGHVVSFVDLTEIIRARNAVRSRERLATIGEVVAKVAHEMRNPLFGITASAQILGMELQLSQGQKELMNSLFSEARRLNNLVEELLDCTKEIKLRKSKFDLVRMINESLSFNEVFLLEKKLELRKQLPPGELSFHGDHERLKQVLVNILKNAVDASPFGGVVTVSLEERGDGIAISVADVGPGVPEDVREKIFDVFFTTKRRGTGLGLPISRKIVEAHGGTLRVGSNGGSGADFTMLLPRSGEAE